MNLRGKGVDGIEALVRWQHPTLGLVPPADFIPMAEESGLILSIERWVLESAMRAAGTLQGERPLKVAVNLSTRHFDHPALLSELRTFSRAVDYDPGLLELELTESGIMHNPKRVLRHLKGFRRLGVRVAIDDFGTGYSCLSLMNRFPLHALKIDRSFVVDCATNPTNQALVAAIIRMGHALGLEVTAEGVETNEQLTYLREQGCDRAQGWLSSALPSPRQNYRGCSTRCAISIAEQRRLTRSQVASVAAPLLLSLIAVARCELLGYRFEQLERLHRLHHVGGTATARLGFQHRIGEAGDDDRGNRAGVVENQLQAVIRFQPDIGDEQVGRRGADAPPSLVEGANGRGVVSGLYQQLDQAASRRAVVVDDEHPVWAHVTSPTTCEPAPKRRP